jgi:signal transduction histidine kinase
VKRQRRSGNGRQRPGKGLKARLEEAETTLEAIRSGEVDAVVVSGPRGDHARAIEGATHPYHGLLNAMTDGAALLTPDGGILFGNRRLEELARAPFDDLRGRWFPQFVAPAQRPEFTASLRKSLGHDHAREFTLDGATATPVWIALSSIPLESFPGEAAPIASDGATVVMAIVTDLTARKRAEAARTELMKRLITAEDDERRRIARELHDETGQSLTALLIGLRTIEDRAGTNAVRSAAQRLRRVTARTIDEVGRLARGLYPSVLDDMGLAAAMRRHVNDFAKSFRVAITLRLGRCNSAEHSLLLQTTVYRILQEALTNAARHARARMIGVELKDEGSTLELVVRDDGVGFDVGATLEKASGLGLHGMQERVALLGGSVDLLSKPGEGTTVRARIPTGIGTRRSRKVQRRPPIKRR